MATSPEQEHPTRRRRPTMAEVAAEAHVSVKTVSRVVNREGGVRPDTAERVRRVVDRLGFRQDGGGRAALERTHTIGLVVEDLANPFYSQIGAAVEREARIHRHQLITASAEGSPTREQEVLAALVSRRVDGLVVVPAGDRPGPALEGAGIPVVYVDRPVRGTLGDIVLSDNDGGIREAVEHLVARGHRRVGLIGDDAGFWTARARREAFGLTYAELGLPGDPPVAMGPHDEAGVLRVLGEWTSEAEPVTAVLAGNNRVTLLVLRALRALGVRLAVVGYDDFEFADLIEPPVTVVHQDPAAIGQKAAQQLFSRLMGDGSPPQTIVMPTRLIVRRTGVGLARRPGGGG